MVERILLTFRPVSLSSEPDTFSELLLLAKDRRRVGEPVNGLTDMVSSELRLSS